MSTEFDPHAKAKEVVYEGHEEILEELDTIDRTVTQLREKGVDETQNDLLEIITRSSQAIRELAEIPE